MRAEQYDKLLLWWINARRCLFHLDNLNHVEAFGVYLH